MRSRTSSSRSRPSARIRATGASTPRRSPRSSAAWIGPAAISRQALYDQIVVRTVRVSAAPARPRRRSSSRTSSAPSTSPSSTSSRSSSTRWASTSGRCSTPPRPSPSASCASTPGPAGAATASRSTPSTCRGRPASTGITPKFIELAGEVNVHMPEYVVEKLVLALNERRKAVQGQPRAGARPRLQEGHRRSAREPGVRDHRRAAAARRRRRVPRPPRAEAPRGCAPGRTCRPSSRPR